RRYPSPSAPLRAPTGAGPRPSPDSTSCTSVRCRSGRARSGRAAALPWAPSAPPAVAGWLSASTSASVYTVEGVDDPALQRILRAHDLQPVLIDQALEHVGAVTKLVGRDAHVGAHRFAHQRLRVV